jgi:outer membrane receptor protein involved in Fe transport
MTRNKPLALSLLALGVLVSTLGSASAADQGRLRGKVLDQLNAITLPGVAVEVEGHTKVFTDIDGTYDVRLPAGTYSVKVSFSGYTERTLYAIGVEAGATSEVDVVLMPSTVKLQEELTVTAEVEAVASTQAAALLERKRAGSISEGLAGDEMRKNADSDAASAMQRVTGVSVVGGQYVFVRGLGERYSNTTLNGAVLPTTEPDKKVVPLDLFPAGLIENVKITKSYLPDKPAEFAGGLLEIQPISFPSRPVFSVSGSLGYNSITTFENGQRYPGGGLDWLGYDDGARALPAAIPDAKLVQGGIFGGGFTSAELTSFGRSFANVWEPRPQEGRPDSSFSVLAGSSWGKLGAVASLAYNHKNRFRVEDQQVYALGAGNAGVRPLNDFVLDYSTYNTTVGGVGNLSYRFSGNHRVALENFYTNSGRDEARTFEGYQDDIGTNLRNARLYWIEETIWSSKLSGEHYFPGLGRSRVDWQASFSQARRDEPDIRENLYALDPVTNQYEFIDESQSGFRMFNDLDDRIFQGGADWSVSFNALGGRLTQVKVGGSYQRRERDFQSRRMRFKPTFAAPFDYTQSPETLFQEANIGPVFQIEEDTRRTDSYDASLDIPAGYAMVDLPITTRLRFVGGARLEYSNQEVVTRDPFDPTLPPITSRLENTDVLPGMNLVYQLSPDVNLRAAYSRTVNRPEFRELAPFEFTDVVGGRSVVGNPNLRQATIDNADLRWEWFPSGGAADAEVLAVSAFWKDFTDPIERVVEATSFFRTSYTNAKGARNLGFEVEARKGLGKAWLVGANYTFVDSKVELDRSGSQIQTNLERPLAGQSQNVFNGLLEFRSGDFRARALVNFFDDRIADVGALGLPDTFEEGRTTLDVVLSQRFGALTVRLAGENLTDAENLYTIDGNSTRLFSLGRSISLGVSYAR